MTVKRNCWTCPFNEFDHNGGSSCERVSNEDDDREDIDIWAATHCQADDGMPSEDAPPCPGHPAPLTLTEPEAHILRCLENLPADKDRRRALLGLVTAALLGET